MKKISTLLCGFILAMFLQNLHAQDNPINFSLAKSHWKKAFNDGEDFFMGASLYNFRIQEDQSKARFKDYIPNGYSLYGGYSYVTDHEGYDRLYSAFEFILGKREVRLNNNNPVSDGITLFNATKYTDYFISVPLRFGYSIPVGRNSFIGLETGAYMLWSIDNKIYNHNGSREVSCAVGSDEQEMRMLDVGWANKITWSYRAFFTYIGFDFGWRNFAAYDADYLLKNQANYSISIGYRFGSNLHEEDMNKLKKISGGRIDLTKEKAEDKEEKKKKEPKRRQAKEKSDDKKDPKDDQDEGKKKKKRKLGSKEKK